MARKRDYKAEERRRNELARQRGFTSRAQQRRAIQAGRREALRPDLLRNPVTVAAQAARQQMDPQYFQVWARMGREERALDWSTLHARSDMADFRPDDAGAPGSAARRDYVDAYMAAFVNDGPDGYRASRHNKRGASEAVRHWMVDIQGMDEAEYARRYGELY